MDNTLANEINQLNGRISELESLIKLLLVNTLIDDSSEIVIHKTPLLSDAHKNEITKAEFKIGEIMTIFGLPVLFIDVPPRARLKNIRHINQTLGSYKNMPKPVFRFAQLGKDRKNELFREKISFYATGKELHLF